ncbi:MAG: response regulator [Anaerolineae bacterium]|nr:response regulator [Anaerolineae bacterium]
MQTKKTVLIIEDDPSQQEIYSLTLQRDGYNTIVRGDAHSGLRWLEQILPDVIMLDVMLPEISGIEMLELIRKNPNGKDVPIIIATASSDVSEVMLAPFNVYRLLRKPILPRMLLEAINELFR